LIRALRRYAAADRTRAARERQPAKKRQDVVSSARRVSARLRSLPSMTLPADDDGSEVFIDARVDIW